MTDPGRESVIVVGAGITGMSAALRLKERGLHVRVLEATEVVGGKMTASRRDGFTLNRGAALLPTTYRDFARLAVDAGVGDQLRPLNATMGVMHHGEIKRIRASGAGALLDGIRTPLLSPGSKLRLRRLVLDALRARRFISYENHGGRARYDTESVGEYCERRLNPEIRDNIIQPLLNGLFLADAMNASVVDLFFTLTRMLGGKLYGTPAGIDCVCRAIAEQVDVDTGARVTQIEQANDSAHVVWEQNGTTHAEQVAGCVVTVPGPMVPELYPQLDPRIQGIINEGLHHVDTISARFALRTCPPEPSLAIVVPGAELDGLASVILEHIAAPACAPSGKALIATFWAADWCADRAHLGDDELIEAMLPLLEAVIPGVTDNLEFAQIDRWSPSNPAFKPGNHKLFAELDDLINPADRVQLAGDYTGLPLVNACVVSGEAAARRLTRAIPRP